MFGFCCVLFLFDPFSRSDKHLREIQHLSRTSNLFHVAFDHDVEFAFEVLGSLSGEKCPETFAELFLVVDSQVRGKVIKSVSEVVRLINRS